MNKNTLENKAKFFAQYWRQKVAKYDDSEESVTLGTDFMFASETCGGFLELKPLSQITDEDAIELCGGIPEGWELFKVYRIGDNGYCGIKIRRLYPEGDIQFNEDGYEYKTKFPEFKPYRIDALRLKGYAVPWNRISVEQQITFGWIRLNTQISNLKSAE